MQPKSLRRDLSSLSLDDRFVSELPADADRTNRPRQVEGAAYSRVNAKRPTRPMLVAASREVAELLGLDEEATRTSKFLEVMSGARVLPGMLPYAMCYGGHQFGNWAGQLGDGRAINLGEAVAPDGARWTLQLKGAGPTPYSRTADGFAVLRSSVREFLCSEAMHHLGVPTTRALSLVTTGELVDRDMFYDGNVKAEPGAIVCRVARSFIRFGNLEICAARGDVELLRKLANYTIRNHFPQLGPPSPEVYLEWFREVCRTTAEMIVHWMRVGFVHGVMNTDNMSILGETIDYGPYGWLEDYDPDWTPNTTDAHGRRYRFGSQPDVAGWNLGRLASALIPLVGEVEILQEAMAVYEQTYTDDSLTMMAQKLGLRAYEPETDDALVGELLDVLQLAETDMTIFYRQLATLPVDGDAASGDPLSPLLDAYYVPSQLIPDVRARIVAWIDAYRARLRRDGTRDEERCARMNAVNPRFVLRNYLAQLAIDKAEQGDGSMIAELLEVLRRPYDEQPDKTELAAKRPDWARKRPGCSMLSCSS
jgi:uncharacterized protein YdiU (UPF0061 family)